MFIIIRHNRRGQGTRRIDRFSISLQACYTNCEMKTEKLRWRGNGSSSGLIEISVASLPSPYPPPLPAEETYLSCSPLYFRPRSDRFCPTSHPIIFPIDLPIIRTNGRPFREIVGEGSFRERIKGRRGGKARVTSHLWAQWKFSSSPSSCQWFLNLALILNENQMYVYLI